MWRFILGSKEESISLTAIDCRCGTGVRALDDRVGRRPSEERDLWQKASRLDASRGS